MKKNAILLISLLPAFITFLGSCNNTPMPVSATGEQLSNDSAAIVNLFKASKANKDAADVYKKQAATLAQQSKSTYTQSVYLALLSKDFFQAGQLNGADS